MLCQKGNNLTQRRVAPIETAGTTSMMATGIVPQSTRDPTRRSSSMDFLCRCAVDRFPLDEEKKKKSTFRSLFLDQRESWPFYSADRRPAEKEGTVIFQ